MEENQSQFGGSQTSGLGPNPAQRGQNITTNPAQVQAPMQAQIPQPSQTWPQPQMPQQPVVQPSEPVKNSSMKNTFLLIIVLILAVILLLTVYLSLANKQSNITPNAQIYPAITTIPTPTQTEGQELDSIDVGDIDADLKEIDTDIQGL